MRVLIMKNSIYGMTIDQLKEWFLENGQKKYRAEQVWDWLYIKRVTEFSQMNNLSKEVIELLENNFAIRTLEEAVKQESADGTIKFLFRLQDGNLIETEIGRA